MAILCSLTALASIAYIFVCASSVIARLGSYPNLFNLAKGKPIYAQPAQSTCSRLFYCRSTLHASSISSCQNADFCDASCPTRDFLPQPLSLLDYAVFEKCPFKDFTYPPPNSISPYSVFYSQSADDRYNCSLVVPGFALPEVGGSRSFFTLTAWISPNFSPLHDSNNTVELFTLIEKVCNSNDKSILVFSVQMNETALLFRSTDGQYFIYSDSALIDDGSWFHLAIQVSNSSMSFFINGTGNDQLPLQTFTLRPENLLPFSLTNCTFHIGQSSSSTYLGHIADVKYYQTALDNREISAIYEGNSKLQPVYVDSECRCPLMFPRIPDEYSRLCLTNDPKSLEAKMRVNPRAHPLEYMTDGDTATYWLSKLINKVVITVDLLDDYQVFYLLIQFYSPLPKKLTIERQQTALSPWVPWQYYADDCKTRFDMPNNGQLFRSDDVNCIQLGQTNTPYSLGNISFSALQLTPAQRPGADTFFDNSILLGFVQARKIRVIFDGHIYDESIYVNERHLYFGVFELTASGRCDCNGHASACSVDDMTGSYSCICEGNTVGVRCDSCGALHNAKPYQKGSVCIACTCNGHATSCVYNATVDDFPDSADTGDGGICVNCGDNTEGRFCENCMPGFYKPEHANAPSDSCYACGCDLSGTLPGTANNCSKETGQCQCKKNVEGRSCDRCKAGFYGLSMQKQEGCSPCSCSLAGVANNVVDCDQISGRCPCKYNVGGSKCDTCKFGYHSLSIDNPLGCEPCHCDPVGASSSNCSPKDGHCHCRKNVIGDRCDQCASHYYNLTINGCMRCDCDPDGVVLDQDIKCDRKTGQCICRKYVSGFRCDVCKDGSAQFGIDGDTGCLECRCDIGTLPGETCDKDTGVCACRDNVVGLSCNLCKPGFWNLSSANPVGCEPCNCDVTGGKANCDQNTGRCSCLPNRIGTKCNTCANGFYKAPPPLLGCLPCSCSNLTSSGQCDPETGQCACRLDRLGVGGLNCDRCLTGFYGYDQEQGSCQRCQCFWPGVQGGETAHLPCNEDTGQCLCKEYVTGRKCDQCKPGFSLLRDDNPYGCSSAPNQQPPPRLVDANSSSITIVWPPPLRPNGVIRCYAVIRNGTKVANFTPTDVEHSAITYVDIGLKPLHYYEYRIKSLNDFGTTLSIGMVYKTLNGAPVGNLSFTIDSIEASAVTFEWTFQPSPRMTPAELAQLWFQIFQYSPGNDSEVLVWRGKELNTTRQSGLTPYTEYMYVIYACNQRSECLTGVPINVTTLEAPPEGQPAPVAYAASNTSVYIEWDPPYHPNGVITFYELWLRQVSSNDSNAASNDSEISDMRAGSKRVLVFHPAGMWIRQRSGDRRLQHLPLPPPARNYTVKGLTPNRKYGFQIVAQNNVGKVGSEWAFAKTFEALPIRGLLPTVTPLSWSQLRISWPDPQTADYLGGTAVNLTVFSIRSPPPGHFNARVVTAIETVQSPPVVRSIVIENLEPYTVVGVKIKVCTKLGCINSTTVNGTTLAAGPQGMSFPNATGNSSTEMLLKWVSPKKPNGPPPVFSIIRVESSFIEPPLQVERGVRFPGADFSQFNSEILPLSTAFFGIEFWFKTAQPTALIFLAVSDGEEEVVSVQLVDGRPFVLVDPSGCRRTEATYAIVTTSASFGDVSYADDNWHKLTFVKVGADMRLTLDEESATQGSVSCANNTVIGDIARVFVGGVPRHFNMYRNTDAAVLADKTKKIVLDSLSGCLRDFTILTAQEPAIVWTPLNWRSALATTLSDELYHGCPLSLSEGVHFLGKGYVVMPSVPEPWHSRKVPSPVSFAGGNNFMLYLSFRAEYSTGLLYFQYSKQTGHVLFVQLVDSVLEVGIVVGNDVESTNATVTRLSHLNFCDTLLKKVRVIKNGSTLTIATEDPVARPFELVVELHSAHFYLSSNVHLGGVDHRENEAVEFVQEHYKGDITTESFGGCFLAFDISVSDDASALASVVPMQVLSYLPRYGNTSTVFADGCPPIVTRPSAKNKCKSPEPVEVYRGKTMSFKDSGLKPFSTYLYSLNASNNIGYALSLWQHGRTLPLPPSSRAVNPPFSVMSLNGRQVLARWRPPSVYSGMLTRYTIEARKYGSRVVLGSATIENPGPEDLSVTVSDLKPHTAYYFYLTVCNTAGCTTSRRGNRNITLPEAPEGMSPPTTTERTPWSLLLRWREPRIRNGELTGYQLFLEDERIYAGQQLYFNVTGLSVATGYRFAVESCTVAGCFRSESVLLSTKALPPPAPVPFPLVTPLSSTEVRVAWSPVDSTNGIIQLYQVYMSLRPDEPLATSILAVDNETNPTTALIDSLRPGETYFFRLRACTDGGCTTSDAISAVTEEAPPEGLLPLTVVSSDPSRIDVFWEPPTYPNGILLKYVLMHNGREAVSQLEPRHYALIGLPPYSRHEFLLKACNLEGCTVGNLTIAHSLEDAPQGAVALDVPVILDPRTVLIRFWGPERPNGNLSYYVYASGLFLDQQPDVGFRMVTDTRPVSMTSIWKQKIKIGNFIPTANYTIFVNATNSKGFILSNTKTVELPKGPPLGLENPVITVSTPRSLTVQWTPVAWSNGDPVMGTDSAVYMLQWRQANSPDHVTNAFSYPITGTLYTLTGLQPYTDYEVRVIASNSVTESTFSSWMPATTPETCPEGLSPTRVSDISETGVTLTWKQPEFPNGAILRYQIYTNLTATPIANFSGVNATTSIQLVNLIPNTNYQFFIEACTSVCCNKSAGSETVKMPSAPPKGLKAPVVVADSPTTVMVSWTKPQYPNGQLLRYLLERQTRNSDGELVREIAANFSASIKDLRFIDRKLLPFTYYEYKLSVVNNAGTSSSPSVRVRTKPTRPLGVLPPQSITPVDPDSVMVTWGPPFRPNGNIEKYVLCVSPIDMNIYVNVDKAKARARQRTSQSQTNAANHFKRVISGLQPYTEYNISISACSDGGGCSESPPVSFRTSPSSPEDQLPPIVIATSQTSMFVQWSPPLKPNSLIKAYTLDRLKTKQPLDPIANAFIPKHNNAWETVYIGNHTYYEDQGLSLFTFYQYRVTAISDFGRATSLPSAENSTFGDEPLVIPELTTSNVSFDSINVSWTQLDVEALRGSVDRFVVALQHERQSPFLLSERREKSILTIKEVPGNQHSIVFDNLIPSLAYTVMMTMHMFGGISKRVSPIRVATSDGTPTGFHPPAVRTVSDSQLRLFWFPPENSNGAIIRYIVYVDDAEVKVLQTSADGSPIAAYANAGDFSTVISGLEPNRVYSIRLGACTKFACGNSSSVVATTVESLPRDVPPPKIVARGPLWLAVRLSPPESPNGIIRRYDLFRKSTDHCPHYRSSGRTVERRIAKRSVDYSLDVEEESLISAPASPSEKSSVISAGKCHYVPCAIGQRQCGGICYASNSSLTCCRGELFETRLNHVCCDSNYVPIDGPLNEQECCGGRLHKKMLGYECCFGNYVPVPSGSTCCYNSMQRNVIVSLGDSCCSSLPYRPNEFAQVCFGGVLLNRPEQKACGRRLIPSSKICCASSSSLSARTESADPLPNHECCGSRYYNISLGKCCSDGKRSNLFPIDQTKPTAVMTCCGLQLIPTELSCCNGKPYNHLSAVCADTSRRPADTSKIVYDNCGRGTLCPIGASAVCDSCEFATSEKSCLIERHDRYNIPAEFEAEFKNDGWPRNWNSPLLAPLGLKTGSSNLEGWCRPRFVRLYSNLTVTTFNDTNLKPYTRYEYFVQVSNSAGSTNSSIIMASTKESPPAGLHPPRIVSNPDQLNILRVNWDPPSEPNGWPIFYKLYRDGVLIFSGDTRSFVDATDVAPFQTYTYWIIACNKVACVTSSRASAATLESVPEGFDAPAVANINSSCANLTWVSPHKPNGLITKYIMTLREKRMKQRAGIPMRETVVQTAGPNTRWIISCNLKPYVQYEAGMEACTQVGCRKSDWQTFLTDAALPTGITDCRVLVVNFIHIDVIWRLPGVPNGPILETILYRRRDGSSEWTKVTSFNAMSNAPWVTLGRKTQNYSDYDVRPGYKYGYKVEYINPAGRVNSSEVMSYGVPLRAPKVPVRAPTAVSVRGARQITVILQEQSSNTTEQSIFDEAIVLIEANSGVERIVVNSSLANFDFLKPYTLYEARVKSCFKPPEDSCSYSDPVFVRTKPAPPEGPLAPTVLAQSSTSVVVTWFPPAVPNGPIDSYEIYRRRIDEAMSLVATIPVVSEVPAFEAEDYDEENELVEESDNDGDNSKNSKNKATSYIDNDQNLQPFTTYEYRVAAVTTAGRGFSPWVSVRTSQARPSVIRPLMVNQTGPYGVEFVWSPPEHTNGPLLHYRIEYRRLNADPSSDVEVPIHSFFVSSSRQSVLISGLKPFSAYSARICAENSVGSAESDWITFSTQEAAPTDLPPIVVERAPTGLAVTLRWDEPLSPNGRITRYTLYDMTKSESLLWTGSGRIFEYRRLKPFTSYSVMLEACTSAGCSKTQPQTFRTAEAPPDLLDPPVIKKLDEKTVKLRWAPPKRPNSEVIEYELLRFAQPLANGDSGEDDSWNAMDDLFRKLAPLPSTTTLRTRVDLPKYRRSISFDDYVAPFGATNGTVVYRIKADALAQSGGIFSFVDNNLRPFTRFHYRLRVRNSRGLVEIDGPDDVETPEAVPARIQPPQVISSDTNQLRLRWRFPIESNGLLRTLIIHRKQYGSDKGNKKILITNFESYDLVDRDVKPDTEYGYALEACTTVGCNISSWRHVRTLKRPPEMYAAPTVSNVSATAATIHWKKLSLKGYNSVQSGIFAGYRISVDGVPLPGIVASNTTNYTLSDLRPYRLYRIEIAACLLKPNWTTVAVVEEDSSAVGYWKANPSKLELAEPTDFLCGTSSRPAAVQTDEALPRNLSAPIPAAISASVIDIQWHEPTEPNGFIQEYVLYRNLSPIKYCDACFSYTDYDLEPATEYSYHLSVRNSIGSVQSPKARVRTASSSPEGMSLPHIKAFSPSTVLVTWEKPIKPNGRLTNFSVYVNTNELVYTGLEQHAYVSNLDPFTSYEFSLEACTKVSCSHSPSSVEFMTPEAPPQGLDPPTLIALADDTGQHSGVRVSWHPPRRLNGKIVEYRLERRRISEHYMSSGYAQTIVGAPVFVYNGTELVHIDPASSDLEPFSLYEYRITAVNSAGHTSSEWQYGRIHTEQAIPENLPAPKVVSVNATSLEIEVLAPKAVNGYITEYRVYLNGVLAERRSAPGNVRFGNVKPDSAFIIHVEACTVIGCTASPPTGAKTPDAAPSKLKQPLVQMHNQSHVSVSWEMPGQPNGNITKHTVILSTDCSSPDDPVGDDNHEPDRFRQPPSPLCHPSSSQVATVTSANALLETVLADLVPYTRYSVVVRMANTFGYSATSPNATFATSESEPQYLSSPRVTEDSPGKLKISWKDSFSLNSPLHHFILTINGRKTYEGTALSTNIFAEKDFSDFSMQITAVTDRGVVDSPIIDFMLSSKRKKPFVVEDHGANQTITAFSAEAAGLLEKPWFVVSVSLIGLVSGAGLLVCACRHCFNEAEKRRRLLAEAEQILAVSPSTVANCKSKREEVMAGFDGRRSADLSGISASGRYVRQRAPLGESNRRISNSKRRSPKSLSRPRTTEPAANNNQFFSLPHNRPPLPPTNLSPTCLSEAPAGVRPISRAGAIEHEAPTSVASLHIEVSGPTVAALNYGGLSGIDSRQRPSLTSSGEIMASSFLQTAQMAKTSDGKKAAEVDDSVSINSEQFFNIWTNNDSKNKRLLYNDTDTSGAYEIPLR